MAYMTVAEAYMLIFGAAVAVTTALTFIEVRRMRKLTEKTTGQGKRPHRCERSGRPSGMGHGYSSGGSPTKKAIKGRISLPAHRAREQLRRVAGTQDETRPAELVSE